MPKRDKPGGVVHEGRRVAPWLGLGALLFAILTMWAVATPLMASPDEPSHVAKAAAVARGEWSGELGPPSEDVSRPGAATVVQLPNDLAASMVLPNCYAFQPEVSGDCQPALPERAGGTVPVETFAGQYPPLYYALVGWPSVFFSGEVALYVMRVVSAALSAVMLAWGAYRVSTVVPYRLALWGALVAVTPITVFVAGTVNPIGWEITTAFSFWAAGLALVLGRGPISTGAVAQATASAALLVNIRESSPLWGLGIVVVLVLLAPPGRLREVVRHRLAPLVAVVAVLASAGAVTWFLTHGAIVSVRGQFPQYAEPSVALLAIWGRSYEYLRQMIGNFGWLDTPAPALTYLGWYVVLGALLMLGLSAPMRARAKAALALLLAAVVLAPMLQFPTIADAGLIWQGRYVLPLAVGLPMAAAVLLGQQRGEALELVRRVFRATVPVVVVAQVAGFYWAARRYSEGASGELLTSSPDWSSPVGYLTGSVLYALLWLVVGVAVWRGAGGAPPVPAAGDAAETPSAASPVPAGAAGATWAGDRP